LNSPAIFKNLQFGRNFPTRRNFFHKLKFKEGAACTGDNDSARYRITLVFVCVVEYNDDAEFDGCVLVCITGAMADCCPYAREDCCPASACRPSSGESDRVISYIRGNEASFFFEKYF